jgi:MFS family permease
VPVTLLELTFGVLGDPFGRKRLMIIGAAMLAAGTHTARSRARATTMWAAALSLGNMLSPVLGGWLAGFSWGSDPNASWRGPRWPSACSP